MLRTPLTLFYALLATMTVAGRTVDVRPGGITAGTETYGHGEDLTLQGRLDASDLNRLTECITDVSTLDLSGVEIVAYKGPRVGANMTSTPAATLPAGIFAGLHVNKLILPSTLTAIGDGALMGSTITEITVPESVTEIGRSAFAGCGSLRSIELPQSVTVIPDRIAEGCEALTSVTLPTGVTEIGDRAFFGCRDLSHIDWPVALTGLGDEACAHSGLGAADLNRCVSLKAIGARAFAHCPSLSSVILPDDATEMGEGVFFECKSLARVSLPVSAVRIAPLTLKGAESLTVLGLPSGIAEIDTLALAGVQVSSLTLPTALNHIADGAFEGCTGLATINGNNLQLVPTLGEGVWAGVSQQDVVLSVVKPLENSFLAASQWQDFTIRYTGIITTDADPDGALTAAFEGMMLTVTSTVPLSSVELFATDGRMLAASTPADDGEVTVIDTSAFAGPFFIVRATTAPAGQPVTFKLLRQP